MLGKLEMLYPDALNFNPKTFKDRVAAQESGGLAASHFEESVLRGLDPSRPVAWESTAHRCAYSERVADAAASRPAPLLVAAALLGFEALAALLFGGIALTQIRVSRAVVGVEVAIWMLGYGVLLLALARGVFLGRRWSRAPSIATQLILLPISFSFRGEPTTWVAAVIAVVAVAALIGLLHPRSTKVFVGPPDPAR
jgi:hypothetical protein